MKRLLLFTMALLMCFVAFGCGKNGNASVSGDAEMPNGEIPLTTFERYSDYEKFLKTAELPENFVKYEDIAHLGAFEGLVVLSDAPNGDYSQLLYNLKDSAGQSLGLYIYTMSREHENDTVIDAVDSDDLRRVSSGVSGVYTFLDIDYRYVSGELLSMTWVKNGVEYVLIGDSMLSDYPQNSDTVVSKMLDRRLVEKAGY